MTSTTMMAKKMATPASINQVCVSAALLSWAQAGAAAKLAGMAARTASHRPIPLLGRIDMPARSVITLYPSPYRAPLDSPGCQSILTLPVTTGYQRVFVRFFHDPQPDHQAKNATGPIDVAWQPFGRPPWRMML